MVALTFPDGARRDYPTGTTGLAVAKAISPIRSIATPRSSSSAATIRARSN